MSGSHYAPPPHVTDNYGDDRTQYDLCPPDALHPLTDLAALRLLCDKQAEAITYLAGRLTFLETHVKALETTVSQHADVLQMYRLREGV